MTMNDRPPSWDQPCADTGFRQPGRTGSSFPDTFCSFLLRGPSNVFLKSY